MATEQVNYRLIAVRIGDAIKYATTMNEIDRHASTVFQFARDSFPHEAITSVRAQRVYDWVMTLGRQRMASESRMQRLVQFCRGLAGDDVRAAIDSALADGGVPLQFLNQEAFVRIPTDADQPIRPKLTGDSGGS